MNELYDVLAGPGLWMSFRVFIGGLILRVAFLYGLSRERDRVFYNHKDLRWGLRSIFHWLIPLGSVSLRSQPVFGIVFYVFHVCLLGVPLYLYAHNMLWKEAFGFRLPSLPEVDPLLAPETRSTGEVLGMADSFGLSYFKAQEATGLRLPSQGSILITVFDKDQKAVPEIAREFKKLGFKIKATEGTRKFLAECGIETEHVLKIHEGRPNIVDAIKNREIQLIINTPSGKLGKYDDSYIRKAAIKYKVPYITTLACSKRCCQGYCRLQKDPWRSQATPGLSYGYKISGFDWRKEE